MEIYQIVTLIILGFIAGIINTLAGGGSNLTLPALMIFGLPPDVANATNRVGIFLQGLSASFGFKKHNKLPLDDFKSMLIPLLLGSLLGTLLASYTPNFLLKYLLLGTMITLLAITLIRPSVLAPPKDTTPFQVKQRPISWWLLLLSGFYGGFVQAGVGFLLINVFAGVLRYDLVKTNALKVFSALVFTTLALFIFILNDQVRWAEGLVLGFGTIFGAFVGVKFAIKLNPKVLKWIIFAMTIVVSLVALFKD